MDKSMKSAVLNKCILNSFNVEADFAGTRNDPYSRSLDEYKTMFDNEIEQLANEYELRIEKKGYVLDDTWEKCKHVHKGTFYSWHDHGFEEGARRESGLDQKYYDLL
nr:RNA-directed DNA polymerase, eukaryota, reverse transcriptase zinc-binding domain protein [Tanacetum cinerariifolium]